MTSQQQWEMSGRGGRRGGGGGGNGGGGGAVRRGPPEGHYGYAVSEYEDDYDHRSYGQNNNQYGPRAAVPADYRRPHPQQRPPPNRGHPNYAYPLRPNPNQYTPQQRPPRELVGHPAYNRPGLPSGAHRQEPPNHHQAPRFQHDPTAAERRGGPPPIRPPRAARTPSLPDEDDYQEIQHAVAQKVQSPRQPQPRPQAQVPNMSAQPPASLGQHPAIRNDYSSIGPEASAYNGPSPAVALQVHSQNNQRRVNPPPRVAIPSYYMSQQATGTMVSPITEESSNPSQRVSKTSRASYASSSAIPADWESGDPPEYYALTPDGSASSSTSDNIGRLPIEGGAIEPGLVRQASMGKRSKPKLTQIGGRKSSGTSVEPIASPALSSPSSDELSKGAPANGNGSLSPTVPVTPIKSAEGSNPSLLSVVSPAKTPRSARSSVSSPLAQPPITSSYFDEKPGALEPPTSQGSDFIRPNPRFERPASSFSQRISAFFGGGKTSAPKTDRNSRTVSTIYGMDKELGGTTKKVPPRLDMNAVREAEARGSLTSLPDLIRRATKAAAMLDDGKRPASGNWGRDSFAGANGSSRNNTDSLSDILATFPAPVLASQRRNSRFSRLSDTSGPPSDHLESQTKPRRRICRMPMWCFILVVILALIAIAAAIVVPLYLVGLQKDSDKAKDSCTTESIKCENGGRALLTNNSCGCVCADGFTGPLCAEKVTDPTCTTYDLPSAGIKAANIGSALPRLFENSASFNIPLDPVQLLSQFSKSNVGCTLQNALVTFNGRAQPDLKRRSDLMIDTSAPPTPTQVLEPLVFDFSRIGVLYIAQIENITVADKTQQMIGQALSDNLLEGDVISEGYTFRLREKTIQLKNGTVVGGAVTATSPP